jgi:hypothetical protein
MPTSSNLDILYNSWKNKTRKNVYWKMAGDMPTRMDWLVEIFSDLDTITELGHYQGCSTAVWLKCRPKKLVTIDYANHLPIKEYKSIADDIGVDMRVIIEDDLKIDIDYTDLLFIDTMHTEDHTYNELVKHGNKSKKYIAFHDVNPKIFGTQKGIDKWLETNKDWKTFYHDINECGFLVLEKNEK